MQGIVDLATQKLCGSPTFNPGDEHQIFAILGQRFGLDIAFGHHHAIRYNDALITNHFRIFIKTTDSGTWSYTTYPSEPIVSAAAAELLYDKEINLFSLASVPDDGQAWIDRHWEFSRAS